MLTSTDLANAGYRPDHEQGDNGGGSTWWINGPARVVASYDRLRVIAFTDERRGVVDWEATFSRGAPAEATIPSVIAAASP